VGVGCSDLGIDRVRSIGCLLRMARCVWYRCGCVEVVVRWAGMFRLGD